MAMRGKRGRYHELALVCDSTPNTCAQFSNRQPSRRLVERNPRVQRLQQRQAPNVAEEDPAVGLQQRRCALQHSYQVVYVGSSVRRSRGRTGNYLNLSSLYLVWRYEPMGDPRRSMARAR